jgi:hypothetical protein
MPRAESPPLDMTNAMHHEAIELLALARSLAARAEVYRSAFNALVQELGGRFDRAKDPLDFERVAEESTRALRQLWLEASASSTSRNYRSPPTAQITKTATGRNVAFGYERDLQPTYLEERCGAFFGKPPLGWTANHILLSSGQAAMAAALHALEGGTLFGTDRKLSFAHLGSYFETTEIFSLFSSLLKPIGRGREAVNAMEELEADIFIIEPIFCDGEFGRVDVARLIEEHRKRSIRNRVYLIDNTLVGTAFPLEPELERIHALKPLAVFQLISGLKLFQGGLELSSVGILNVYTPEEGAISASQLGDRIRRIRTLLGLGLSFAEVAALEAPWFLDREYTQTYQRAIFENNALLAQAVAAEKRLFSGVFHPSLLPDSGGLKVAPFSVFRLREHNLQAYGDLEEYLCREVPRRGILFEQGGSFGFRGHRFEVVRPEDGEEPFLRVALGRRAGWSRDQIIKLMTEISRVASVAQLTSPYP